MRKLFDYHRLPTGTIILTLFAVQFIFTKYGLWTSPRIAIERTSERKLIVITFTGWPHSYETRICIRLGQVCGFDNTPHWCVDVYSDHGPLLVKYIAKVLPWFASYRIVEECEGGFNGPDYTIVETKLFGKTRRYTYI